MKFHFSKNKFVMHIDHIIIKKEKMRRIILVPHFNLICNFLPKQHEQQQQMTTYHTVS